MKRESMVGGDAEVVEVVLVGGCSRDAGVMSIVFGGT